MLRSVFRCLALSAALFAAGANAAVTVTIQEAGSDVVASFSGTLDTGGLTCVNIIAGGIIDFNSATDYAYLLTGSGTVSVDGCTVTYATAQSFGGLAAGSLASSGSGVVGVEVVGASQLLYVPAGYTSGTSISGTSTFSSESIASLALTPGTFLFDYGADQVTFVVVDPNASGPGAGSPTAVPATPLWTLLLTVGLITGIVGIRRAG